MTQFTPEEIDMASKGYAYRKQVIGGSGLRPTVKNLSALKREDVMFDVPAYQSHLKK